jgi:uncharacterized protein (DUF2267 family)
MDTFIATVEDYAGVDREEAERAIRATLETLGERLTEGEVRDIAAYLPDALRPFLRGGGNAGRLDLRDFLGRVSERAGVPMPTAARYARAVFTALGRALPRREQRDLAAQLPDDFAVLLEAMDPVAAHVQPPPADELPAGDFVQQVADHLGVERAGAWPAIDAVLEMLGRRISHGEVDDLVARLPAALAGPLEYGVREGGEDAVAVPVEGFVRGIVERERVTPREAIEHARAVFAALRDSVGDKELSDELAQLPQDYDVLLPRAGESESAVAVQVVELVALVG